MDPQTKDKSTINKAIDTLKRGGTILYPTDTIWGIGCDASCSTAIEKIYKIKKREPQKSMLILCSLDMVDNLLTHASSSFHTLHQTIMTLLLAEKPTTVIFPAEIVQPWIDEGRIASNLPALDGSLGIRVARHDLCQKLISQLNRPLVSTSANFSGEPSPLSYNDIDDKIKESVDFWSDEFKQYERLGVAPSAIIKVNNDGTITNIR